MITGGSSDQPCCCVNGCQRNCRSVAASSAVFTPANVDLGAVGNLVASRWSLGPVLRRQLGRDLAQRPATVVVAEVIRDPRDQALRRLVVRLGRGREALDALGRSALGQQLGQMGAEALTLELVADHDGELGRLGVAGEAYEARDRD